MKPENNFLSDLKVEKLKTFKKRMMGCILATDMAKHAEDLASFKLKLETKGIKSALNNGSQFLDRTSGKTLFESQQQMMEVALHAADVSVPCRPEFGIVRKWTYLLFEEFFEQGDLEKAEALPVSFLCDRVTTNVAKSQNGFISFIVQPLFTQVTELMPGLACMLDSCRTNKELWDKHEETEQEKKSYVKVDEKPIIESDNDSSDESEGSEPSSN
mgnify:CR=1 FL=1